MAKWTAEAVPVQDGRVAIITGANSGLGFENAVTLASKGATVVMACRNADKGKAALEMLQTAVPGPAAEVRRLDLASLAQIEEFAAGVREEYGRLDILINNAGLMAIPRWETEDGFEMQFGVNHLGHFALTGRLMPLLADTPGSRVVTVSSMMSWMGTIDFEDLQRERAYTRYGAYGQSKLANILFALELDRRLGAAGMAVKSMPAHPGYAATSLQQNSAHHSESTLEGAGYGFLNKVLAQDAEMGALPQLYAATAEDARAGSFYGPERFVRGYPTEVKPPRAALNEETARRLWAESEALTGVSFDW